MKYKDYFYLLLMLFIASINFNLFLKPLNLVVGGTQGLSLIIHHFIPISFSIIILIINIIMFILSLLFLNKKITISLVISTFIYPLFIKLTSNIDFININIILIIIIVGIISGITNGIIYKLGFSSGGISILSPLINKYTNIKIGTINFIINFLIMLLNLLIFGINNLIYSLIIILINSTTINIILYSKRK